MQSVYLIDYKGKFRGSFKNIRDAQNYAFHTHINSYCIKKIQK